MTGTLRQLRIVIVEDEPVVRQFLRDIVESDLRHAVVGEAATGTDMVRTVLEEEPDVVLFDIHLPFMTGLDALHQIYQTRVVAAVAITADRDTQLVQRAQEEHVLAYLVKPVEAHQLGPALQIAWARFLELQAVASENSELRQAMQDRKIVERAKGLVMKTQRCSEETAFRRLQRLAMDRRMPLVKVAHELLANSNAGFSG